MKKIIVFFFIVSSLSSFSQIDSRSIYISAIENIKSSKEFNQFIINNNIKDSGFSVQEIFYPICVFCQTFNDKIECCKSADWLEIWPNQKVEKLNELGNKKNKKLTLLFTNTENSYFLAELSYSKLKDSKLFLFQINNGNVELIETVTYKATNKK